MLQEANGLCNVRHMLTCDAELCFKNAVIINENRDLVKTNKQNEFLEGNKLDKKKVF